jgi:hypothetical protein
MDGHFSSLLFLVQDALWTPGLLRISRPGAAASLTTRSETLLRDTVAEGFLNGSLHRGHSGRMIVSSRPGSSISFAGKSPKS